MTPTRIVVGLGVLFVLLLALAFGVHEWRKANGMREQMRYVAYDVSKSFVRKVVVSSESAKFAEYRQDSEAISNKRDDGDYATSGWVESLHGGGAAQRVSWRCLVHPVGDTNWKLIALSIDDKTLYGKFPDGP